MVVIKMMIINQWVCVCARITQYLIGKIRWIDHVLRYHLNPMISSYILIVSEDKCCSHGQYWWTILVDSVYEQVEM